jgi:hypothetical protein
MQQRPTGTFLLLSVSGVMENGGLMQDWIDYSSCFERVE